jgi:hypothetical protein
MVNGRTPLYLTLLAGALFAAAVLTFQPYSADWPGTAYAKPARQFVRAALRQDSAALSRLSASAAPVRWALAVARSRPDSLASWARRPEAWTGERRGDTAEVFLYPSGAPCARAPIALRFVGSGDRARVLSASSACLGP